MKDPNELKNWGEPVQWWSLTYHDGNRSIDCTVPGAYADAAALARDLIHQGKDVTIKRLADNRIPTGDKKN